MLQERYLPLLEAAKENCLLCVVAMKKDLLTGTNYAVTPEEAERFAVEMNANRYSRNAHLPKPYFETSSLTGQNVHNVFEFIFQTLFGVEGANSRNAAARKGVVNVDGNRGGQSKGGCC